MLPHWSETLMNIGLGTLYGSELRVLLQPNSIELILLKTDFLDGFKSKHGFKSKIVKQEIIDVKDETTDVGLLTKLLTKLSDTLQNPIWHKAAPVLVFSNTFMRYAVLPWNAEIKSKQERSAYLQHSFLQHFGVASKNWLLCEHIAGYGKTSIASGVDKDLLKQLEAVFEATNMTLKASYPMLMVSANLALAHIKQYKLPQSFWLADVENNRLTIALIQDGNWKLVRNLQAEQDVGKQIAVAIQRESVVMETSDDTLPVLLHQLDAQLIHVPDTHTIHLQNPNSNQEQAPHFANLIQAKLAA